MSPINTTSKVFMAALFASLTGATPFTTPVAAPVATQVTTPVEAVKRDPEVNGWFYWYFNSFDWGATVGWTSGQCQPVVRWNGDMATRSSPSEGTFAKCWYNDMVDCVGSWSDVIEFPGGESIFDGKWGPGQSFMCDCGDKCIVETNIATTGPLAPPTATPTA